MFGAPLRSLPSLDTVCSHSHKKRETRCENALGTQAEHDTIRQIAGARPDCEQAARRYALADPRTDERGEGGAGHRTHTDTKVDTCDPDGPQTATPYLASRAIFRPREALSTCKANRHSHSGRTNRMRCMATQQAGHRARSRTELGKRVHEGRLGRVGCAR